MKKDLAIFEAKFVVEMTVTVLAVGAGKWPGGHQEGWLIISLPDSQHLNP